MTQYCHQFGRRWDVRIPRADIQWLMGRVHVGTPDDAVAADIRRRCTAPGFNARLVDQTVAYALECHRANQALYNYVMKGTKA